MRYTLITAPASEPVTISDLTGNEFLKSIDLTDPANIAMIESLIKSSRQLAEEHTGRAIITQTWELIDDCAKCFYEFQKGNLTAVSSVKIVAEDSTETTEVSTKYSISTGDYARLWLREGQSWTESERMYEKIKIRFVCGWANAATVPPAIKHAIMVAVAYFWTNRESVNEAGLPPESKRILAPFRLIEHL
jgi:uncharacterized phiE125 gp8 family phage protein